ncbi:MAG: Molybdopterin oxidoreductase, Psr/Psh family, PsrC-like rane anchor subunit, partial [Acidobacteria bacterium]|nr:Molybdopterin oxidoreductase, Psr/Psh family, PsrC-like rane anchor subunit [Acidobacteriota bacterium]
AIDPILHIWGWEIPVYLFLGGMVAGAMILLGYSFLTGRHRQRSCACSVLPALSLALLSAGMLALFLDLEHKLYVWRLYTTFELGSPMSWGSWILVLVYPALAAAFLVRPPAILRGAWPAFDRAAAWASGRGIRVIGAAQVALGVALGIYTGILLSSLGARPFWSSAILGPLFLFSGLSSAAALTHMVARDPEESRMFARADNAFLGVELLLIALFLIGLVQGPAAHREAAHLVLDGPFTAVFWVFVVGLGIVLPLVVQSLAVAHRIAHTPVAPLLVLAGGLALRFVIVYAGQYSHWTRL